MWQIGVKKHFFLCVKKCVGGIPGIPVVPVITRDRRDPCRWVIRLSRDHSRRRIALGSLESLRSPGITRMLTALGSPQGSQSCEGISLWSLCSLWTTGFFNIPGVPGVPKVPGVPGSLGSLRSLESLGFLGSLGSLGSLESLGS